MAARAPYVLAAAFAGALLLAGAGASSEPGAVPIDGIVALVGSTPGDVSAAAPVLASDVALHAALAALVAGPRGTAPAADPAAAERELVLIALLARQARLGGEEVDPAAKQAIIDTVTANAGGPEALAEVLGAAGAAEADLGMWAGDVALAERQIEYMRERIDPPTERDLQRRFAEGRHPYAGAAFKDVKRRVRDLIVAEQLAAALAALRDEALADGTLRILR